MSENTLKEHCLVIFSGGQDSSTTAAWAKAKFAKVSLIAFDYNQRHKIELTQAKIIAKKLDLPLSIIPITFFENLVESALFLNRQDSTSRMHKDHSNLPASFVPNRNALFITLAHAFSQKIHANHLALGVSEADYSGYPDCRGEFIDAIIHALNLGSQTHITIHTPLKSMNKAEEFALARDLNILDLILEDTHTCYEGIRDRRHAWGYGCGICPACELRKAGYEKFLQDF